MVELGRYNTLKVQQKGDHGAYLDGGSDGLILMPRRYVSESVEVGESVRVFVYSDSEDRLVATTETPYAQVGEIAYLEVVSVNEQVGAFLDWGLAKDLLLPFREQDGLPLYKGDGIVVAIYVDQYTRRIAASTKLHRYLPDSLPEYEPNDPVHVLIYGDSPLGYKAIVDKRYRGLLYHEETSDKLETGDQFTGYIKKVRSGGKIDLRRDPSGYERVGGLAELILGEVEKAGGSLEVNDKSAPEEIRKRFNTSKKAFKQALGALYKTRRICFTATGIALTKD